jgi:hypothetical protein
MKRKTKRLLGNLFAASLCSFAAFWFFTARPTPKEECNAFRGIVVRIDPGRRHSVSFAIVETPDGKLRLRSNNRTINRRLLGAPVGSRVEGLLDCWDHVVEFSLNDERVLSYAEYSQSDRELNRLFAIGSLLVALVLWIGIIYSSFRPTED